jgi:hypothetical protein
MIIAKHTLNFSKINKKSTMTRKDMVPLAKLLRICQGIRKKYKNIVSEKL